MTYQSTILVHKRKSEFDQMIKHGLKNMRNEPYDMDRLNLIIENEKAYQALCLKTRGSVTMASEAMVVVCEILKSELNKTS